MECAESERGQIPPVLHFCSFEATLWPQHDYSVKLLNKFCLGSGLAAYS